MDEVDDVFVCLCEAASAGRTDIINNLLKQYEPDVDRQDEDGNTPLHLACQNNKVDCVRALLRAKYVPSLANHAGALPFTLCDEAGRLAFQTELLQQVATGNTLRVTQLLGGGVNPDVDGLPDNSSVLYWALSCAQDDDDHHEVIRLLLDAGVNTNLRNANGNTVLHDACAGGHLAVARLLVQAGADCTAENVDGKLPGDLCPEGAADLRTYLAGVIAEREKTIHNQQVREEQTVDMGDDVSIRGLRHQIRKLKMHNEEYETVIAHLRRNIEVLLTDRGHLKLVSQHEKRIQELESQVEDLERNNKQLKQALVEPKGEKWTLDDLGLPSQDALDELKQQWLATELEASQKVQDDEVKMYQDHIRALEQEVHRMKHAEVRPNEAVGGPHTQRQPPSPPPPHPTPSGDQPGSIVQGIFTFIFGDFTSDDSDSEAGEQVHGEADAHILHV